MEFPFRSFKLSIFGILFILIILISYFVYQQHFKRIKVLEQIIERLQADSRIAEVLVTNVKFDEAKKKNLTTIKFLEYDSQGNPQEPKYFTFTGNIIQFQSLVIRFEDIYVRQKNKWKGKSLYLFWKVFMLDGSNTQEFVINPLNEIPSGYRVFNEKNLYETRFWQEFWAYALDAKKSDAIGVKNAQIEAPGTIFIPGYLYTLRIEHDGGIRIDAQELPKILKGETTAF